jgi:hypothetical protein
MAVTVTLSDAQARALRLLAGGKDITTMHSAQLRSLRYAVKAIEKALAK